MNRRFSFQPSAPVCTTCKSFLVHQFANTGLVVAQMDDRIALLDMAKATELRDALSAIIDAAAKPANDLVRAAAAAMGYTEYDPTEPFPDGERFAVIYRTRDAAEVSAAALRTQLDDLLFWRRVDESATQYDWRTNPGNRDKVPKIVSSGNDYVFIKYRNGNVDRQRAASIRWIHLQFMNKDYGYSAEYDVMQFALIK